MVHILHDKHPLEHQILFAQLPLEVDFQGCISSASALATSKDEESPRSHGREHQVALETKGQRAA